MSYFNAVAHDPPTVMISVGANKKHPDGMKGLPPLVFTRANLADGQSDTSHNIKETKEFCVSIISETFVEASNYTAIDAPDDVDEWKLSGLTQRKSECVLPLT